MKVSLQHVDNTFRCVTVPQVRGPSSWQIPTTQDSATCIYNSRFAGPRQRVGPLFNGNGTLGIPAERHTRNTQNGGLLLNTAGISQDEARLAHQ